jgi:hypothetical protein
VANSRGRSGNEYYFACKAISHQSFLSLRIPTQSS